MWLAVSIKPCALAQKKWDHSSRIIYPIQQQTTRTKSKVCRPILRPVSSPDKNTRNFNSIPFSRAPLLMADADTFSSQLLLGTKREAPASTTTRKKKRLKEQLYSVRRRNKKWKLDLSHTGRHLQLKLGSRDVKVATKSRGCCFTVRSLIMCACVCVCVHRDISSNEKEPTCLCVCVCVGISTYLMLLGDVL